MKKEFQVFFKIIFSRNFYPHRMINNLIRISQNQQVVEPVETTLF